MESDYQSLFQVRLANYGKYQAFFLAQLPQLFDCTNNPRLTEKEK